MIRFFHISVVCTLLLAGACSTIDRAPAKFCESSDLLVDAMYEGGNFHHCTVGEGAAVSIVIRPEDEPPINRSPWYSFRLSPKRTIEAQVKLTFIDGYARYWPKVSHDGNSWAPLAETDVNITDDGNSLSISIPLAESAIWISAQERVLPSYYDDWIRELSDHPDITTQVLGRSVQGRPIHIAKTGSQHEVVFLIGRQHPPEVTGAFAMRSFVDAVMSDSELARSFRDRFSVVVVPLINPDGVVAGHWRHNMNGVDLNRDWGPFTQPETQSVARLLATMDEMGLNPKLMLDFHSTRSSLFYTQMPDDFDEPVDFATTWLTRSRERLPNFEFKHDPRPPSGQDNTKNFFFSRYNIPAITYEIGDEVARQDIVDTTPVFAEEMMRLMLER